MHPLIQQAKSLESAGETFFLYREPQGEVQLLESNSLLASRLLIADAAGRVIDPSIATSIPGPQSDTPCAAYLKAVENAKQEFAHTSLEKVVLSRVLTIDLGQLSAVDLFERAVAALPQAFCYVLQTKAHGIWVGASPERLIAARENDLEIDSIAATRPLELAVEVNHWNDKERDEQEIVTVNIERMLEKHGATGISKEGPQVLEAGPIAHLHTRLKATLEGHKRAALIKDLHPTPAVGGHPKAESKAFVAEHEAHDRRLYSGYLGPWQDGVSGVLYVNIRCMQVFGTKAQLYLGCGITPSSIPEDEWLETERKARTWLDILAH